MSFLFGFLVCVKLFLANEEFLGVNLLLISLMQLLEFFLWIYLKNETANLIISFFVFLLILLQPTLFTYYANKNAEVEVPKWAYILNWVLVSLFILKMIWNFGYLNYRYKFKILSNANCRLNWGFKRFTEPSWFNIFIWTGIISGYIYPYLVTKNEDILTISGIALVVSLTYDKFFKCGDTFESFWCFMVNLISAYILVLRMPNEFSGTLFS